MVDIRYNEGRFGWVGSYDERVYPLKNGWHRSARVKGVWVTEEPYLVEKAVKAAREDEVSVVFSPQASLALEKFHAKVAKSWKHDWKFGKIAPSPKGLEYLPYQQAGIAYALGSRSCIIGDEMGLGKTIQAIGVLNAMIESWSDALVVCPASLMINWGRELNKWLTGKATVFMCSSATPICRVRFSARTIHIISWASLHENEQVLNFKWDYVIADEVQNIKDPDALRTKALHSLNASRRLGLTGTPLHNKPKDLWSIIKWVDPEFVPFKVYANRFCDPQLQHIGGKWTVDKKGRKVKVGGKKVWFYDGAKRLDELRHILRGGYMVRRLKKDVMKDLPPKRRQVIELGQVGYQKSVLDRIVDAVKSLSGKTGDYKSDMAKLEHSAQVAFETMSEVRHEDALRKVPAAVAHIKNLLESTDKVIVFAHHRDVIDGLMEGLNKFGAVKLVGGMPAKAKQKAVDLFQEDEDVHVFVGNIKAAGVGLTLTASSTVCFVEFPWVPGDLNQCEDRAHRKGQENSVLIQYLVLDGTIDGRMAKALLHKQKVCDEALDASGLPLSMEEIYKELSPWFSSKQQETNR